MLILRAIARPRARECPDTGFSSGVAIRHRGASAAENISVAGGGAAAAIMTSARARALSNIENVINNRDTLARGNCGRDNLRALYTRPKDFPIRFHRLAAACSGASSRNHLSPRDEQRVPNLVRPYLLCFAPPETRPSRARARAPLSRTGVCCPLFRCDSISIDGLHSTDVIKYTSHRSG